MPWPLDSLLVGYQSPGGPVFAGRVGTGFSGKVLANLYNKLQELKQLSWPFVNLPKKTRGRWGLGITPAVMKRCEWVKPVLIAQVNFTEWTHDGQLRQPVFLGLRTNKEAKDFGTGIVPLKLGEHIEPRLLVQSCFVECGAGDGRLNRRFSIEWASNKSVSLIAQYRPRTVIHPNMHESHQLQSLPSPCWVIAQAAKMLFNSLLKV